MVNFYEISKFIGPEHCSPLLIRFTKIYSEACSSGSRLALSNNHVISDNYDVYPNPGNGFFAIDCKNRLPAKLEITITDVNGRIVFNKKVKHAEGIIQINCASPAGVYLLKLTDEREVFNRKVVIVR